MKLSRTICRLVVGTSFLTAPVLAQKASQVPGPPAPPGPADPIISRIDGEVLDLTYSNSGILYCTREGEVGAIRPSMLKGSRRTVFAPAGTFPHEPRAVAQNLAGNTVVLVDNGDIYELPSNTTPAVLAYDDLWMISNPTDLILDEAGRYYVASKTPSTTTRAVNRISADGVDWGYHVVRQGPAQIVADPISDDILMADLWNGGALRAIDGSCSNRPITGIDTVSLFGFTVGNDDGDMACENDGDVYLIAGGNVWFRDRAKNQTTLFASGYGQLRGVAIAGASSGVTTGLSREWSLYLAEGSNPTLIHEIAGVGPAGTRFAADQGPVPDEGDELVLTLGQGLQTMTIAADNNGDILLGGHLYQTDYQINRYEVATGTWTQVAHQNDGLSGQIQGLTVAPDDTIYALTRQGRVHAITENPLSVTLVYADGPNQIGFGCSLARDVDGTLYIADRDGWGLGELVEVIGGAPSILTSASEARGISADPQGGGLFLTEWNGSGFNGTVSRFDFGTSQLTPLPNFDRINYSNGNQDGDTVVDVNGSIYSCSEDDWSVVRYDPPKNGFTRVGSGYTSFLSGLELSQSTPASGSTTGFSLYVSTFNYLYEIPSVAAPASDMVDRQAPRLGSVVSVLHPQLGRPRDLIASGGTLYVATSAARVLAVEPTSGLAREVAGPTQGLTGDLVALRARADGRLVVANRAGDVFLVHPRRGGSARRLLAGAEAGLEDVSGLLLDRRGRPVLTSEGSRGPLLTVVGRRGAWSVPGLPGALRPQRDPASGDLFFSARGQGGSPTGSLLRYDPRSRRVRQGAPGGAASLLFGERDGGLAFDPDGNLFLASTRSGRVVRVDRESGAATVLSGGHRRPVALATAEGPTGAPLLWVLDDHAVHAIELGR
jgi:sugar lactone lactonase YvrE